ncbi:MAG TPA: glycine oxidase ThiO [Vicinamibacteria bacterium]|nr:glycine oxidase ThiO [Vicinamibacteria bacterium]
MAPDVIVVGGGIVGLSAARELRGRGARVVVVERGGVGEEASSAAAGMLAPQVHAEGRTPLLELSLQARDRHLRLADELLAETGLSVELSRRGALDVAFSEAEEQALVARARWQADQRMPVEVLSAEEVRQAEPNLSPSIRRAVLLPGDRCLDNVRLVRALAASAVARGAALLCGRPVTGLVVEEGRAAGVRAADETIRAPIVINASGAWASLLAGDPEPPPVEPVRGQIVSFEIAPAVLRHVVWSPRGYVVPRPDGRLIAGSTVERAGFDKSVTAGGLRAVLDIALEIVPRLADVRICATWAGLRPATPDGWPILGAGALPGLFHAAGLFRNGILLGPLAGETVARLALGEAPGVDLAPFSPARFHRDR